MFFIDKIINLITSIFSKNNDVKNNTVINGDIVSSNSNYITGNEVSFVLFGKKKEKTILKN